MNMVGKKSRYLIAQPFKWYTKFKLSSSDRTRIYQTYLMEDGIDESIVSAITSSGRDYAKISYLYTMKTRKSSDVDCVFEYPISQSEYCQKLKEYDPIRDKVYKSRYSIGFNKKMFQLDVFEEKLFGLCVLETDENLLPPHFSVLKDITDNEEYAIRELALKDFMRPVEIKGVN